MIRLLKLLSRPMVPLFRWLGHKPWFARVFSRVAPPMDRAVHRLTGGRLRMAELMMPTLTLTTTGRRSGKQIVTPLSCLDLGDRWAVVGSNWGQAHHPGWSWNLVADPRAVVERDGRRVEVAARLVDGAERDELWQQFLAMWPAYQTYVGRADGRELRLFVLEPTT